MPIKIIKTGIGLVVKAQGFTDIVILAQLFIYMSKNY